MEQKRPPRGGLFFLQVSLSNLGSYKAISRITITGNISTETQFLVKRGQMWPRYENSPDG